ncbi:MAG: polyprenyl synthetase family protein [Labilithrix sp.]|nr:polyprenyl synthetase family protein [Labilithrix sp.]
MTTLAVRVESALADYRGPIASELERIVDVRSPLGDVLYEPIRRHALRPGKGLRPAICIATCLALGGSLEAVLPTAAVLELFHNAFLLHDDVEDGSQIRRDEPAFQAIFGPSMAINAGDAMLALALKPLLDNTRVVGLGKALRILDEIALMARETAEGQAIELDWIRRGVASPSEDEYVALVERKTASYSFVAPATIGAIIAGATDDCIRGLRSFGRALGVAFQIRDDVLNLDPENPRWGKDNLDDLWEGKRTLILSHALRNATEDARERAESILALPRPSALQARLSDAIEALVGTGDLSSAGRARLQSELSVRSRADVEYLFELIEVAGSLSYASDVATRYADEAARWLGSTNRWLGPSAHSHFLFDLLAYVRTRDY